MGKLKYKGYTGSVEYSEEDNCLFGKVQGLTKDCITYEGNNVDELRHDFEEAVDCYLASCEQRGVKPRKPYSGVLNIQPFTHQRLCFRSCRANAKDSTPTVSYFAYQPCSHVELLNSYPRLQLLGARDDLICRDNSSLGAFQP